jgi:hypothetical protein
MKMVKKLLSAGLCAAMMLSAGSVYASDADAITIDSILFSEVEGDDTLVKATVGFTAVYPAEEITILMATEDSITVDSTDDIMYINQVARPEAGVLEFVIEKSRILASTEADDVNDTTMYVKMGGTDIDTMAASSAVISLAADYIAGDANGDEEVTSKDALAVLRYEAGWELANINEAAMDVNADDEITSKDALAILRYEAGWEIELKK